MKKSIIILGALLLALISCDTTDPKPPEEKPPGYQEDIPWPSLADSPWPMFRGHPMGTGRLKGTIPQFSEITKMLKKFIPASGAVVGEDGSFYFISYGEYSGLVCLDNNGEEKWFFELEKSFYTSKLSTPIILNNDDIIIGYSRSDSIFSISTAGKLNWKISLNTQYELTIGKDGTIYSYSTDPSAINSISRDGELLWKITNNNISTFGNMVLSPDGTTLYTTGVFGTALLAYDILTQNLKWQLEGKVDLASPLIDSQGNI